MHVATKLKLLLTGVLFAPCLIVQAQKAASDTSFNAGLKEARQYLTGLGKKKDRSKALVLYTALAQKGSAKAMNITGVFYKDGLGIPKDRPAAIKWFTKAINGGVPEAWYNLGLIYQYDVEGGQDYARAFECFMNGAKAGHLRSSFMAGYNLYKGLGVQQDYKKAIVYFRQGASRTEPRSQYFLGLCLRNGYGVTASEDSARYWLGKSAAQKFQMARNELASPRPENSDVYAKQRSERLHTSFGGKKGLPSYQKLDLRATSNLPEGRYTGTLIKYDWGGNHAIGSAPLMIDVAIQNNEVILSWTESDSIRTQLTGVFSRNGISFRNTGATISKYDHYSKRKPEQYRFERAGLNWARRGDTVYLQGNVQLYSMSRHEPAKPVYISVAKAVSRNVVARTGFKSYPNPFSDLLTVEFELGSSTEVTVQLIAADGKTVYEKREGLLLKGAHRFPVNARQLPAGTYVMRVLAGNDTRITQVVKK